MTTRETALIVLEALALLALSAGVAVLVLGAGREGAALIAGAATLVAGCEAPLALPGWIRRGRRNR